MNGLKQPPLDNLVSAARLKLDVSASVPGSVKVIMQKRMKR